MTSNAGRKVLTFAFLLFAPLFCFAAEGSGVGSQARGSVPAQKQDSVAEQKQDSVTVQHQPRYASVKANALLAEALVTNIGFEIGFADHFSFNLPIAYSPYTLSQNWRIRTFALQPEMRFWFKQNREGFFLGLHGHMAYYNISISADQKVRYQDRDGCHPLVGGGLDIGYGFAFGKNKKWGVDLSVGPGYAYLDYDKFHNVDNGAEFSTGTRGYWGITNAAVNISYRFAQWNKKKKK